MQLTYGISRSTVYCCNWCNESIPLGMGRMFIPSLVNLHLECTSPWLVEAEKAITSIQSAIVASKVRVFI